MSGASAYSRSSDLAGGTPRETEALAFGFCNARLQRATTPQDRVAALYKTHQLWSILVRDLGGDANTLPASLRSELVGLGLWAMHYCLAAMSSPVSLQPLMDVNQNLADGLRSQIAAQPAMPPAVLQRLPAFSA